MQDSLERLPDEHPEITNAIAGAAIVSTLRNIHSVQLHDMVVDYISMLGDVLVKLRPILAEEPNETVFVIERKQDGTPDSTVSMSGEAFANLLAMKKLDEDGD